MVKFVLILARMSTALLLFAAATPARAQFETTLVSAAPAGAPADGMSGTSASSLSADGRYVAFASLADNLVASDTNAGSDVFVFDRVTGATTRVSVDSSGAEANNTSYGPSISADGHLVTFFSFADNLVAVDSNSFVADVFVHDVVTGSNTIESVDSAGTQGNGDSFAGAISGDGQVVVFASAASNLVAGDTNQVTDIFVHDRTSGQTERVSVASSGAQADDYSMYPAISADGQVVMFGSAATNLVASDQNGTLDVFVHDRNTGLTTRVSVDSAGGEADDRSYPGTLSSDGTLAAFQSNADNLIANDRNYVPDVFVHDRGTGATTRVSVDSAGVAGDNTSVQGVISNDGQVVGFSSVAANLAPNDNNGQTDVFVHRITTGETVRVSTASDGSDGNGQSYSPALSGNGLFLAFQSDADDLVPGDSNGWSDVFASRACSGSASWNNYGSGLAGTNGVPGMTARANPVLGSAITIDIGNSLGYWAVGFVLIGFSEASVPTNKGGTILVGFSLLLPSIMLPGGSSLPVYIPFEPSLCGVSVFLQTIEVDAGAPFGLSFTPGLELDIGD